MSSLNNIVKSNRGYEIGHISHRKDGDYKKVGKNEWEKVGEESPTKSKGEEKDDLKIDFDKPRDNGIGGSPYKLETGIRWGKSDVDDDELVIEDVYVTPTDRKKGIGRKLVESAIKYAKDKGFKQVGLYAEPQEKDGISSGELVNWYRDIGFESDPNVDELMTYEL